MCIMSAEARRSWLSSRQQEIEVSQTKLFARIQDGVQHLVHEMAIATSSEVAMVLPLPVAHVADDAVEFLDFSNAKNVFADLARLFPERDPELRTLALGMRSQGARPKLVVRARVGRFRVAADGPCRHGLVRPRVAQTSPGLRSRQAPNPTAAIYSGAPDKQTGSGDSVTPGFMTLDAIEVLTGVVSDGPNCDLA